MRKLPFLLAVTVMIACSGVVWGQNPPPILSRNVQIALAQAQGRQKAGAYAESLPFLRKAEQVPDRTVTDRYFTEALKVNVAVYLKDNVLLREALEGLLATGLGEQKERAKYYGALGGLLNDVGDLRGAEAALEQAAALAPNDPQWASSLAILHERNGEPGPALDAWMKAIAAKQALGQKPDEVWIKHAMKTAQDLRSGRLLESLSRTLETAYPSSANLVLAGQLVQEARQYSSAKSSATTPVQTNTPSQQITENPTPVISISVASRGSRFALVIGNSAYDAKLGPLANPANDARVMADALKDAGFAVDLVLNADQKTMKRAISRLGERMNLAGGNSTGLFFYAGHGLQSRGVNYLVPVGAAIEREADVDLEAVAADTVLAQMEEARASTNIIILDACRNTPMLRSFRSGARGLARMEAPNGSFISYSTAPGAVAEDGTGSNSPFALSLARQLKAPGQPIEILFRNVRREVLQSTEGRQIPWDSSSLTDSFVFVGQDTAAKP